MGATATSERLVGRAGEVALLRDMVETLITSGVGTTVLIQGEGGIGKTSLADALAERALASGVTVLRGESHPFERARPFAAIARAFDLRTRSPDVRRAAIAELIAGDPDARRDSRYRVVEELVELAATHCRHGPTALILEDLHWADESTLLAFRSLVHDLAHAPLLAIATLRPSPRSPELDQLVAELLSGRTRVVGLPSLSPHDVDALVRNSLGKEAGPLLSSIVAKAGGNPLWVVELLRSLASEGWIREDATTAEAVADDLPGSLRELVLRRMRYLPPATLDLLQLAVVLGDAVSVRDLATVARRPASEIARDLAEAYRASLLDAHDDALVFRHQLVHDAIYEDLAVPLRRALHRDAAGALARAGADPGTVAAHLVRGADRGDLEAVRWLRVAAAQARGGGPGAAIELLQFAAELLPEAHPDADLVQAELADTLQQAGRVADAAAVARAVLRRPHRDDADVRLRLALVSALSLQNRGQELIVEAAAALDSPNLRPTDRALVLAQESYGRTFSGDFVGGEATARRALEIGDAAADRAMTVWSLSAVSVAVKTQGRYAEALEAASRAVALAFDPCDPDSRLRHPHFFLAMALSDSDDFDGAREAYRMAAEECEELSSAWLLPDVLLLAAELRFLVGEWDDAATEFEAGLVLAAQHGQRISIAQTRAYQAVMAAGRGDLAGAGGCLDDVAGELENSAPCYGAELVGFAAALLADARGEIESAYETLMRAWKHDLGREVRYYHRSLGPLLVRAAVALGQQNVAAEVAEVVGAGAVIAPEVASVQSAALRCAGLVDGDPDVLLEAITLARRSRRVLDHAGACEDAATLLMAAGRNDEAGTVLLEALSVYESIGATAWASRTNAALRGLGIRRGGRGRRRRPSSGVASLTPSEHAVARLVAEGLTNRQVGKRLHVSPHTVNTHLRHVFQKLSVTTRTGLAHRLTGTTETSGGITHSSDVSGRF